ncbi:MAG: polysaccharide biosynthesis tyrosine autokinase, partial [Pseudomonadota bacterium]
MNEQRDPRAGRSVDRLRRHLVDAAAPQASDEIPSLWQLMSVVWQGKLTVAAFGFGFALAAMALVYMVTPLFTATSVVMLDEREENIIDVENVISGFSPDFYSILAEIEVLQSRKLAGRVVDAADLTELPFYNPALTAEEEPNAVVGLIFGAADLFKTAVRNAVSDAEAPSDAVFDAEYWAREQAIDVFLENLSVRSVSDTYVYALTVQSESPVLSADLANRMANLYILEQLETKFEATEAATQWLSDRVAELEVELEQSEAAVETFNKSTDLVSEESFAAASRQLKELRERRDETSDRLDETTAQSGTLAAAMQAGDLEAATLAAATPALSRLAREAGNPAASDDARTAAEIRFEQAAGALLDRLRTEEARLAGQIDSLDASVAELSLRLESQTADMVELRQLQRESEAQRRIYEQFLRRLNETSVQQGVQQADARVLSPAVADFVPAYPRKTLTVLAAGFLGGLVGIAVVLLLDKMNRSFRTPEQLERFSGLSVLGTIPVAPVRMRRGLLDYARSHSSSSLMEAIRNLRTGVLTARIDDPPQVIMLSSSLPKEGKTTTSLLLAQNAASLGKKALLIECDFRRRTFRNYFDTEGRAGLMSLLMREKTWDEIVHHDEVSGLDVIIGEESQTNAADVFASQRFREFVEE